MRAAEQALATRKIVTAIDVLTGIGWLSTPHLDQWRQGRTDFLERVINANLSKITDAMKAFHGWARNLGLKPSETVYVSRTRDRRHLRFSKSGAPEIERRYRTHYISRELTERKQEKIKEMISKAPELVVISPLNKWSCTSCGLGEGLLIMDGEKPLCMKCVKMDHLVILPAGDAGLTRRAKALSSLSAVVVRFSRTRNRYERQGLLVEEAALTRAQQASPAATS